MPELSELKKEKELLTESISKKITDFQNKYGVEIESVKFDHSYKSGSSTPFQTTVKLKICLP